jgi:ABC-type transport system substrate-binding protein
MRLPLSFVFKVSSAIGALFLSALPVQAEEIYKQPPTFYEKLPTPPKGGEIRYRTPSDPKVMNPVLSADAYSSVVEDYLWMGLMTLDPENLNFLPSLADRYLISDDKKTYSFFLNPQAQWQDGTPVTSADVQFTFDLINNPKTHAAALRSYYSGISVSAPAPHIVVFHVKEPKFDNLFTLSMFRPIQAKQFKNSPDFNQDKGIMFPIGNGPYIFEKFERSQKIVFARNKNWWAKDLPLHRAQYNIDKVNLEIIGDQNLAYERFIKETIDDIDITPEQWALKVNGVDKDKFSDRPESTKKLWMLKEANKFPKPYSFIGWNAKNPIFQDVETRKALSYLVNYKKINEKVFYNLSEQSTSPFGSFTNNSNPVLRTEPYMMAYDRKKAVELLKKAGWENKGGATLVKNINGKQVPFQFSLSIVNISPTASKIAQILKEDFKVFGIQMNIQSLEWNSLLGKLDNRDFDAISLAWTSTLFPNARQIWHSQSQQQGGSNFVSYSNPQVDRLIDEANKEFDPQKRSQIMQEINTIIYEDQPYTFLFEPKFVLEGLNTRIHSPKWLSDYAGGAMSDLFYLN